MHQVMSSAPSPMKKRYFEDMMATNALEAATKHQKAELEQQQLLIAKEKAEVELMELQNHKKAASIAGALMDVNGCNGVNACNGVMTGNDDSADASSAKYAGNANVNGNTTTAGSELVTGNHTSAEGADVPLCSWPICKGLMAYPIGCMQEGCMGTLHHCCLI